MSNGIGVLLLVYSAVDLGWLGLCLLHAGTAERPNTSRLWKWNGAFAGLMLAGFAELFGLCLLLLQVNVATVFTISMALVWTVLLVERYHISREILSEDPSWMVEYVRSAGLFIVLNLPLSNLWTTKPEFGDKSWGYLYVTGLMLLLIFHLVGGPLLNRL